MFLLLLVVHSASSFMPSSSSRHIPSKLADISQELEETWSNAAMIGEDAAERTTSLIKDRAFDCRTQVMKRTKEQKFVRREITEDSIEKAAAEFMGESIEKDYDINYRKAISDAENGFLDAITRQEEILKEEIHEISSEYDQALSQTQFGLTEDDIFMAKQSFIQRSAVVDELFQIAIERAELANKEAIIEAAEERNEEVRYYEKFGRYMPDKIDYNAPAFANLIAF